MSKLRLRPDPPPPANAGLMRVTVQVGARRFDEDLEQQAMITPNVEALNDGLAKNPARFAEWAMLEALARAEVDGLVSNIATLDSDLKELEAAVYLEVIRREEKLTVDAVKATVTTDPRRLSLIVRRKELETARLAAKDVLEKVMVGRKTMEQKKDSLLALASNWRSEMATKLQVGMGTFKPGGR